MENVIEIAVYALIAISVIGILTSALIEVIKKVFNITNTYLLNVLVLVLSELLVVGTFIAYCQINQLTLVWYNIALSVFGGLISCGIALFGFDKYLKPVWEEIGKIIKYFGN